MHGTNHERLLRLLASHVRQPRFILPWLSKSFLFRSSPLDLALPWFSFAAIEHLSLMNLRDKTIFEYGSGGSTLWFASRCKKVIAAESDPEWAEKVIRACGIRGADNVDILLQPASFTSVSQYSQTAFLHSIDPYSPDVVIIDHYETDVHTRPVTFVHVQEQCRTAKLIIVDDSWRYESLANLSQARKIVRFQSTGPARLGVTSTDFHWY